MDRYRVERDPGHSCCMEASVVDTTKANIAGEQFGFEAVCECFDFEMAERIAAALNKEDEVEKKDG
jgi:hypothetical protein